MKKTFTLLIALILGLAAYAQPNVVMKADSANLNPGDTVWIPVTVRNFRQIVDLTGTLSWDTSVVSFCTYKDLFFEPQGIKIADTSKVSDGSFTWTWASVISIGPSIPDGDTLFMFKFQAVGNNGASTPLAFNSSILNLFWRGGTLANSGPIDSVNGFIAIGCANPVTYFSYTSTGLNYSFKDSSTNGAKFFHWEFGDGDTSTMMNPMHMYASGAATYDVCLITTNDCGSDTICKKIVISPSSIEDLNQSSLKVYPNPTQNVLTISSQNRQSGVLEIFNVEGKRVLLRKTYKSGTLLNIENLNSGMYNLRLTIDKDIKNRSFIKE